MARIEYWVQVAAFFPECLCEMCGGCCVTNAAFSMMNMHSAMPVSWMNAIASAGANITAECKFQKCGPISAVLQMIQAEADEEDRRAIQRHMYRAFNDLGGEATSDSNPLARPNKLTRTNPLL